MNYTPPAEFLTTSHPRRVVGAQLWCLSAWLLLLTGAMAQTSDSSTTTTDTSGGVTISGSTLTLSNSTVQSGTSVLSLAGSGTLFMTTMPVGTTATATTITNTGDAGITTDSSSSSTSNSLTIDGSNTYTGATITYGGSGLTLSSAVTINSGIATRVNLNTISAGNSLILKSSDSLTFGSALTTFSGSSNSTNNLTIGTVVLNDTSTNSAASMLSTIGTLPTYGTLIISSGGVFNLAGISASGLTLVGSTSLTAAGGTTLGNTGLTLTTAGAASQYTNSVNVAALGSTPVGKPSTSSSFANAVVSLVGVGNVNGQSIAERGVIYSQTTVNSTPSMGAAGVTKIALGGLPDPAGSFSLPTGGLAPSTNYSYRVYAIDSAGNTYLSGTSAFTTPTVLQNWRQTFFGTTQGRDTAADNSDPDGDGVPNLVEFATGKNPTTASSAASSSTSISSSGTLDYTYTRSLDALNSGTTFIVEWNDTLDPAQWSSAGVTETVLSDNGLIQQVKATMPAGATGRRFVHLKVLPPAAQ